MKIQEDDIEFEEENFLALMNEAKELHLSGLLQRVLCKLWKRAKLKAAAPNKPMEIRAEKALEAIYVCCFGQDPIEEEEDKKLLCVMLNAVFPSIALPEVQRIVEAKTRKVAEGSDGMKVPQLKPLPQEAIQLQMKDLQFLKQNQGT